MDLVTPIRGVLSQTRRDSDVVLKVKAGRQVSGALTKSGSLYTWGRCGKKSILGYPPSEGDDDSDGDAHASVVQSIPRIVSTIKHVVNFDFGIDHAAAVTEDGSLYTWGEGKFAQLGLDDLNSRISPTRVAFPDGVFIVDVGCGNRFNVCITTSGRVLSWGVGTLGQLGHDQKRRQRAPKEIEGLSNIIKVSCGQDHAMVLDGEGTVYSWGHAEYGCLGRKPKTGNTVPGVVPLDIPVSDISCGSKHNAVIVNDGRVFSWGLAGNGRLGLGPTRDKPFYETPQEVSATIIRECGGARSISCGHKHTACTTNNGIEILVWGCAEHSRLGVAVFSKGNTKHQNLVCDEPIKASMVFSGETQPYFTSVSCGNNHSLACDADGEMYSFGAALPSGNYGQVGTAQHRDEYLRIGRSKGRDDVASDADSESSSDSSGIGVMVPRHSLRPKQLLSVQNHGGSDPHPSLNSPASKQEVITASFHNSDHSDSDSSGVGELGDEHKISTMKRPKLLKVEGHGADPHPGLHTPTMREQGATEQPGNSEVAVLKKAVNALQKKLSLSNLKFGLRSIVQNLNKHHTVVLSNALHHWRLQVTVNCISEVAVGEFSRMRDDHDRLAPLLFRNAFFKCYVTLLRRGFNKLTQNWMVHNALEATRDARKNLEQKLAKLTGDQDRAKQRLHYNREILRSRLLKTSVRYGRDKIVAVISSRQKHSVRNTFARWKLHAQAKEHADSLRRGRLKLRVNMDRIEMDREKFEVAQQELASSRKMFGVFLAFHKWRQHRQRQMYAEEIAKVHGEREFLKRELSLLLQHMEELQEARNTARRVSLQRGSSMIKEVEEQIQQVTNASEKRKLRIEAWTGEY